MNTIVFEGSCFTAIDLYHHLPRHENFPFGAMWRPGLKRFVQGKYFYQRMPERRVFRIFMHHTGGSTKREGFRGPLGTAEFVVRNPPIIQGAPDATRGRGWPGMPYHVYLPFAPVENEKTGLPEIYRCWPFDWEIWHTKGQSKHGLGVVLQGSFKLTSGRPGSKGQPSKAQMQILAAALDEWIKPECRCTDRDLYGHCDVGKPSCPGGTVHRFVKGRRSMRASKAVEL